MCLFDGSDYLRMLNGFRWNLRELNYVLQIFIEIRPVVLLLHSENLTVVIAHSNSIARHLSSATSTSSAASAPSCCSSPPSSFSPTSGMHYLRQGGFYVLPHLVVLLVGLFVCQHYYSKTDRQIFVKFLRREGNPLDFWSDLGPDLDPRFFLQKSARCGQPWRRITVYDCFLVSSWRRVTHCMHPLLVIASGVAMGGQDGRFPTAPTRGTSNGGATSPLETAKQHWLQIASMLKWTSVAALP